MLKAAGRIFAQTSANDLFQITRRVGDYRADGFRVFLENGGKRRELRVAMERALAGDHFVEE